MITATVGPWSFVADRDRLHWSPLENPNHCLFIGDSRAPIVSMWSCRGRLVMVTADGAIWILDGLGGTPEADWSVSLLATFHELRT